MGTWFSTWEVQRLWDRVYRLGDFFYVENLSVLSTESRHVVVAANSFGARGTRASCIPCKLAFDWTHSRRFATLTDCPCYSARNSSWSRAAQLFLSLSHSDSLSLPRHSSSSLSSSRVLDHLLLLTRTIRVSICHVISFHKFFFTLITWRTFIKFCRYFANGNIEFLFFHFPRVYRLFCKFLNFNYLFFFQN